MERKVTLRNDAPSLRQMFSVYLRTNVRGTLNIDTTSAGGKLVFGIFAALAEFERELIRERTNAGLVAMKMRDTSVADLCNELGTTRATLYRYVGPNGELREHGRQVLGLNP